MILRCRLSQALLSQPGVSCRVALFNLEEYESAKAAFEAGQALDNKNSSFKTWIRKCAAEMDGELSITCPLQLM